MLLITSRELKIVRMSTLSGIFNENLVLLVMGWLNLREYGLLDLALTNVEGRKRWMTYLSSASEIYRANEMSCKHSSLRWLIERKIHPKSIFVLDRYKERTAVVDRSFVGIDNKFLLNLVLSSCGVTDSGLLNIALGCPQLKAIDLYNSDRISDNGILALAVNLPGITSIKLSCLYKVTSIGVISIAERCPNLLEVSLNGNGIWSDMDMASDNSIVAIARGCPNLQTMSISYCSKVTDRSVLVLAACCKELKSFSLICCNWTTDKAITAIANSCPELESLTIGGRSNVVKDDLVVGWGRLSDKSLRIVGEKCPKLARFTVQSAYISDISISALPYPCPQRKYFDAYGCHAISIDGIMALSHGCKELREINLKECLCMSDESLSCIAGGFPELTTITITECKRYHSNIINDYITDSGISCLARGCQKLKHFNVRDIRKIGNVGLIALASNCPDLRSVEIFDCGIIDDSSLTALAFSCPDLQDIALSECKNITDEGLNTLALESRHLKSISLHTSNISDASLIALANNSRELQRIDLSSCHRITPAGMSVLAVECAQIKQITLKKCRNVKHENLLSLRRKYLHAQTEHNGVSEYDNRKSVMSIFRHFFSCK